MEALARRLGMAALALVALAWALPFKAQLLDPLLTEITRCEEALRSETHADSDWQAFKGSAEKLVADAKRAWNDGRRIVALLRLMPVYTGLEAQRFVYAWANGDLAGLEREWRRIGEELQNERAERAAAIETLPPAPRAIAEAAEAQVRPYYQASLQYAQNTAPRAGFYYLGNAKAQAAFAELTARLAGKPAGREPKLRKLDAELDALDREILEAYKPPASIDKHPAFIRLGATLKQARELNAAGYVHGALLRYLEARLRFAQMRRGPADKRLDAAQIAALAAPVERRLRAGGIDNGIGALFLDVARLEASEPASSEAPAAARAVFDDVLPHYFSALQPPPAMAASKPGSAVTVTLVRWPYT